MLRQFGQEGDHPVPCDVNDGGISDYVVFRPQNGAWFRLPAIITPAVVSWGTLGDKPRYRRAFFTVAPKGDPDIK
jgi:hypothetical protein